MYIEDTEGISVEVENHYVEGQSRPDHDFYYFAYKVRITNNSEQPIRVIDRHWFITDGKGSTEQVRGPGVVGEQPEIQPGKSFEYMSACPLSTKTGNMRGTYGIEKLHSLERIRARIPLFFFRHPDTFN